METLALFIVALAAVVVTERILVFGVCLAARPRETLRHLGCVCGMAAARAHHLLTGR